MSQERISFDRSLLEEYAKDSTMLLFLVNVLLVADRDGGTFSTSIRGLAKELNMSVRQVRTCMLKLKERHTIDTLSDTRSTQITVCDIDSYTDERHTIDTLSDTRSTHRKKKSPSTMVPNSSSSDSSSLTPLLFPQEEIKGEPSDEGSGKTDGPFSVPPPFSEIMQMWNGAMTRSVPKIVGLSETRKEKIKLRFEEMGGFAKSKEILLECFRKINDSDFCNGKGETKWVASFDWFFSNGQNWMKVHEGNYDNKRQVSRFEQSMDVAQRAKSLIGLIYGTGNTGTTNGITDTPDER